MHLKHASLSEFLHLLRKIIHVYYGDIFVLFLPIFPYLRFLSFLSLFLCRMICRYSTEAYWLMNDVMVEIAI